MLIPLWGYEGSGICLVVSEVVMFTLYYLGLRRELGHRIDLVRFFAFPALALGAMYAVSLVLQKALVSGKVFAHEFLGSLGYAAVITLVVLVLYVCMAWVSRAIDRNGLQRLNSLLQVDEEATDEKSEKIVESESGSESEA